MKVARIIQAAFNPKRAKGVVAKVAKSEARLNQAKLRQEQQALKEAFSQNAKPVYYFEDLNFLGLPKWY